MRRMLGGLGNALNLGHLDFGSVDAATEEDRIRLIRSRVHGAVSRSE